MDKYVVFVVDADEDRWETATEAEKRRTYAADQAFVDRLAARGGRVVGGQELAPSRRTRWLTRDREGAVVVTDGPYAETVEQLSGFYVVECPDLDALTEAVAEMLAAHTRVEVRPVPGEE